MEIALRHDNASNTTGNVIDVVANAETITRKGRCFIDHIDTATAAVTPGSGFTLILTN